MRLEDLGWDDQTAAAYEPWAARDGHEPARVAVEFNHLYRLYVDGGEVEAAVSGAQTPCGSRGELPPSATGWWREAFRGGPCNHLHVLPRRSCFSRKVAGGVTDEQVVAANVDVVFLVMAPSARGVSSATAGARQRRGAAVLLTKLISADVAALAEVAG